MAHFAYVENGIVTQVLVIDQDVVDAGMHGDPAKFVKCSYNTAGGVHKDGGTPVRKNYPGKGFLYDGIGFYAPQPYPSWTKDASTYLWDAPTPMPTDGLRYQWDEPTLAWVEVV